MRYSVYVSASRLLGLREKAFGDLIHATQQAHMHGAHEIRPIGTAVRRKGHGHTPNQFVGEGVVGVGGPHHALLELVEISVVHGHVKTALGHLLPGALGQGSVYGGLGCGTHHTLVIEQAHDLVEGAVVHGLGHVQVPAGAQHPRHLAQSLIQQGHRHMMQRFEHQGQVE
jgi:hypothetical protein